MKEFQKKISLCFIDNSKDFDWVNHGKLWITALIGVEELTRAMAWGTKTKMLQIFAATRGPAHIPQVYTLLPDFLPHAKEIKKAKWLQWGINMVIAKKQVYRNICLSCITCTLDKRLLEEKRRNRMASSRKSWQDQSICSVYMQNISYGKMGWHSDEVAVKIGERNTNNLRFVYCKRITGTNKQVKEYSAKARLHLNMKKQGLWLLKNYTILKLTMEKQTWFKEVF